METVPEAVELIDGCVAKYDAELVEFRRDLHRHPELSWAEQRATERVAEAVERSCWQVRLLPRSGLVADLGEGPATVALRADLDALPVDDLTDEPWSSTVEGAAHACGHDVHTTAGDDTVTAAP